MAVAESFLELGVVVFGAVVLTAGIAGISLLTGRMIKGMGLDSLTGSKTYKDVNNKD